jgi:ABC-2 type transport system permease protein
MNKTFIVFKQELRATVLRKSFFLTLFLIPIIGFVVTLIINNSRASSSPTVIENIFTPQEEIGVYGLIDQSGIIQNLPEDYKTSFILYQSEQEAAKALQTKELSGYYLIDSTYLKTGKVVLVKPDFNPLGDDLSYQLESLLNQQILAGDPKLLSQLSNASNFKVELTRPEESRDPNSGLTFFLPYAVTMIFYIIILGSSSLMLNSVTNEKTNRVLEILMTSIQPMQMLSGKIIALGLVGLAQTIVWSGTGLLLLRLSGGSTGIPLSFQLPTSILFWGILFFIGGYALYASLMAGLGALVPNLKEASQATTVLIIPLIIPMMLINAIVSQPNGVLSIIFSFLPFTSPVTMMTRLSAGNVPAWQILTSFGLLILCDYFVLRSISNFFRAQTLLSGSQFKMKFFFKALFGKNPA